MKRAMRLLSRLYPSSWRKRYGAEFDALLEDSMPSVHDTFDVLCGALKMQMTTWGSGKVTLASTLAGILVAVAVALFLALPAHYLSQAVLIVSPADESVPADQSAPRLVDRMQQKLYGRDYLASVIHEHNLYWRERLRMPLDDVVENMRRDISVVPVASPGNRNAYTVVVQFDYSDPRVAQRVNEELTSRFIEGGLNSQLVSNWTFRVPVAPSLPLRPVPPNRVRLMALCLLTGLFAGLTFAIVLRSRRTMPVG
jgi:hypothetical protein